MNMNILQGPQLANPDAFNSVDELRSLLAQANESLLTQFLLAAQRDDLINQLVMSHNNVLMAHLSGDDDAVKNCLESYLSERPRLREKLEEWAESNRARKPH